MFHTVIIADNLGNQWIIGHQVEDDHYVNLRDEQR